MHDQPPLDAKKTLRRQAAEVRRQARAANPDAWAAVARLAYDLADVDGAVVAGYWPMGDEMDVRPLMMRLREHRGCRLCLPTVIARARPLVFREWRPTDDLEAGEHNTFHPPSCAPELRPSLVLVPLLAFDRKGYRLGYGGGYYDRTLESLRSHSHLIAVGVGFAAQEVAAVPADDHDQRLDAVATENGLMMVGRE